MKEKEAKELINAFLKAEEQGKSIYMDADQVDEALDWLETEDTVEEYCKLLEAGLRLHPNYLPLLVRKCFHLMYEDRFEDAYDLATSLTDSQDYEVYAAQIDSLFCMGRTEEAFRLLEQRVRENCKDLDLLFADVTDFLINEKMLKASRDVLMRGIELFPDSLELKEEFNDFIALACELPQAIRICKGFINSHPYTSEGWSMLGKLQVAAQEYDKAIESFDFAALCGNYAEEPDAKMLKAYCHYMNGNLDEAIKIFEDLRSIPELKDRIVPILAECYLKKNRIETCYSLLRHFIDQTTFDIELSVLLNFQTCCLILGKWQEAESVLELASEMYPTNVIVLHRRVISYTEQNDMEKAYDLADEMFRSIAGDGEQLIMKAEKHEEAKALFSQALQLYLEKDFSGSLLCFRKAYEAFPEMRILGFFAAIACLGMKDIEGYLRCTHDVSPEEVESILDKWFFEEGDDLPDPARLTEISPATLARNYLKNKNNHN